MKRKCVRSEPKAYNIFLEGIVQNMFVVKGLEIQGLTLYIQKCTRQYSKQTIELEELNDYKKALIP